MLRRDFLACITGVQWAERETQSRGARHKGETRDKRETRETSAKRETQARNARHKGESRDGKRETKDTTGKRKTQARNARHKEEARGARAKREIQGGSTRHKRETRDTRGKRQTQAQKARHKREEWGTSAKHEAWGGSATPLALASLFSRCSAQKMACSVEYRLRAVVDFSQYQTPDRSTCPLLSRTKSNLNNAFHTGYNLPSSLAILCAWILAPSFFVHPNPVEKHKEVKNQTKN